MTPCQDPANDPDDWFLGRDGKQYSDDILVTDEDVEEALISRGWPEGVTRQTVIDALTAEVVRENLTRRRHAKDLCHTECPARFACLGLAFDPTRDLPNVVPSGTWGGYFEEERKAMATEVERRRGSPRG